MKDTYHLWIHPVVVGSGQRLVREGSDTSGLRLLDRHAFNADVVVVSYQPAEPNEASTLLLDDWQPSRGQSITELALAMLGVSADQES